MNAKDRDELSRISERTLNIWRVVEKLEQHQETQNGLILETIKITASNTTWRRVHTLIIGAMWAGIIAVMNRVW